jgi:stage V sporulation protein K
MVGLVPVKREVNGLIARLQVEQKRRAQGLTTAPLSLHMVFTGPPGVGKTEVARALGDIYRSLRALRVGHLVEVQRADLVAGFIGQTAPQDAGEMQRGAGWHSLHRRGLYAGGHAGSEGDFGREAIDTLLKFMEDHRDRIMVIVAGYPNEMRRFIDTNPGLAGRFTKTIDFPRYSADEMCEILRRMAARQHFTCRPASRPRSSRGSPSGRAPTTGPTAARCARCWRRRARRRRCGFRPIRRRSVALEIEDLVKATGRG